MASAVQAAITAAVVGTATKVVAVEIALVVGGTVVSKAVVVVIGFDVVVGDDDFPDAVHPASRSMSGAAAIIAGTSRSHFVY